MEILNDLPPLLMAVVGLLLLAWLILLFLVPFMIEGIRGWTRKNHEELRSLNAKLDRLEAALRDGADSRSGTAQGANAPHANMRRPTHPAAAPVTARREPTLSELPPETGTDSRPRPRR